ncbi:MAG TPA: GntR family transcriptional regulator [Trueperaceae bacterium]
MDDFDTGSDGNSPLFSKVRPRTLKSQIATAIRQAILAGRLKPGDRISEAQMAQEMGVSRAPIREAINQLQEQGLVVVEPHKGSFIRELNPADIRDLIRLRAELEGYVGELLIDNGIEEGLIASLNHHMDAMIAAADEDDFLKLVKHDQQFHVALYEASRSRPLIEVMNGVAFRIRIFMVVTKLLSSDLHKAAKAHSLIIHALMTGDRENIRDIMKVHIEEHMPSISDLAKERSVPMKEEA